MRSLAKLLLLLSIMMLFASCAREIIYQGPTPTDEYRFENEHKCS